jgi:putative sterol carrier protein
MGDPIAGLFAELGRRGYAHELQDVIGALRFELTNKGMTECWLVAVENGKLRSGREDARADCVVRLDRAQFEAIVRGELNAVTALLRGAIVVTGDPSLVLRFHQLFRGWFPLGRT